MTVVAFVEEAAAALSVVTCAGNFAAGCRTELVIFYIPSVAFEQSYLIDAIDGGQVNDATNDAIVTAIKGIVQSKRARKGRLPKHAVSLRRVLASDPINDTISRIRMESPNLFVGAPQSDVTTERKSKTQQIAAKLTCDVISLLDSGRPTKKIKRIVAVTSDGRHDLAIVEMTAQASLSMTDGVTVLSIEASFGEEANEVQERQLRSMLRELSLTESSRLKIKAIQAEEWVDAVAGEACASDLLLVGTNMEKKALALLDAVPQTHIGLFRRAPLLVLGNQRKNAAWILPQINPTDYADLYEQLQAGSRWNSDFITMLSLAAGIATLGLLQSSAAVVIGSMLLAPLMTPMIGMGLALNQGNSKLAQSSFRAIGRGFIAALAISFGLALITPGSDLTPEVIARTEPNVLDLLIALFSGSAAAYALARPSIAGAIAGVAIATALVPPLCSAGISLAYGQYAQSFGALSLLLVNVLAIILAAAATFRAMGLSVFTANTPQRFWVRHVVRGLIVCVLVITIPLTFTFMKQVREGKNAPFAFSLTNEVREKLMKYVDTKPGVEIIYAGRSGVDRESDHVDIGIILSSKQPLPRSEAAALEQLLRDTLQNPELAVRVECVKQGWAEKANEPSKAVSYER